MKVLKIGGSVLTDKSRKETLRPGELERLASEVAQAPDDLVLVHGAGSFGHPHVEEHLSDSAPERLMGAALTHRAVSELSNRLIDALRETGTPALPVRPLSCATASDGSLDELFLSQVERMLEAGALPVLHGDVVVDRGDISVVSGDEVVVRVARDLKSDSVGFGTNVDGVLDGEGDVLRRVTAESFDEIEFYGGSGIDSTGGMKNKVESLLDAGVRGAIFNAESPGNVEAFLRGEEVGSVVGRD